MKILAFSDLHDEEAALDSLSDLAPSYDHVFACGDLTQSVSFAEEILARIPNALVIPGNWDSEPVDRCLSASPRWLHGRSMALGDGLSAAGFGYSNHTPFGTFGELDEDEIYAGMSSIGIDGRTMLLLHCPPKGRFDSVGGKSVGSASIARIIEERQPLAAFCGHIHEHHGTELVGRTTLVKLPPAMEMHACSLSVKNKRITADFISL